MKIQIAVSDDIPEILEMMADLNSMYGYPIDRELNRQNLVHFLSSRELGRLWIIDAEDEAAGYAVLAFGFSFEYGGRDAFIDELYLKEKFRGKGIGTGILKLIEREAVELGVKTLHLEVDEENEHGKRLYSKSGFSNNGRLLLNKKISASSAADMKAAKTFGLTHIAIAVKDIERTLEFYKKVFDMEVMYHEKAMIQLTTPGCNDILVFEERPDTLIGNSGGIAHFGFRLRNANDIDEIHKKIIDAGGVIVSKGEFVPGSPNIFFKDPDGYTVEVWYELLPDKTVKQ